MLSLQMEQQRLQMEQQSKQMELQKQHMEQQERLHQEEKEKERLLRLEEKEKERLLRQEEKEKERILRREEMVKQSEQHKADMDALVQLFKGAQPQAEVLDAVRHSRHRFNVCYSSFCCFRRIIRAMDRLLVQVLHLSCGQRDSRRASRTSVPDEPERRPLPPAVYPRQAVTYAQGHQQLDDGRDCQVHEGTVRPYSLRCT